MHCRYELKNKGSPNRNISITFVSGFWVEFLLTIQIMRQYANLSYILLQLNSFSVLEMMDTIDEFLIKYVLDFLVSQRFSKVTLSCSNFSEYMHMKAELQKSCHFSYKTRIKLCRMSIYIYSSWTPVGAYKFEGEPSMDIFKSY